MDHVETSVANSVHASDVYRRGGGRDDPDPEPGSGAAARDIRMAERRGRQGPRGTKALLGWV